MPDLERVQRVYRRLAPSYDRNTGRLEALLGLDRGREWVCARARGRVLELGVGTGLSLAHYGAEVQLTGVDASSHMLDLARRRAAELGRRVDLRVGDAHSLDSEDGSFDAVVFAYSLCTIADPDAALREAQRLLRDGGSLLLTEHVRSPNRFVRGVQRVLDPLSVRFDADHLVREPLDSVLALGFVVRELERWAWGIMERLHAVKPA